MKKNKRIAFFTAVCMTIPSCVYAKIDKVSCEDYETGKCIIVGSINDLRTQTALFRCLKAGYGASGEDAYADLGEISVNDDGSFSHTFYLNGETGNYVAGVSSGEIIYEKSFVFVNNADTTKYINEVNSAQTSDEMQDIFEKDNNRLLKICGISYSELNITNVEYLYNCIYNSVPNGGFKSLNDIKKIVRQCAVFNGFTEFNIVDADKALNSLFEFFDSKYDSIIRIYNNTNIVDDNIKKVIITSLQKQVFASVEELQKIFAETVLYNSLKATANISQKKMILETGKEYILLHQSFPEAEYYYTSSENDKNSILTAITGAYNNVAEYIELLTNAVKNHKNKPTNENNGGGAVGTGSGNGGTISPGNISQAVTDIKKEGFGDIDSVPWAKTAIENLFAKGIVSGVEQNRFEPNKNITREEYATMLVKAFNPQSDGDMKKFSDIEEDKWYYSYIRLAYLGGFIRGISETEFGTGCLITRQDAALMAYNAATASGISIDFLQENERKFVDYDTISVYARQAVGNMYHCGIISGMGEGMFMPVDNLTRAQAACIIYKLCRYVGIM